MSFYYNHRQHKYSAADILYEIANSKLQNPRQLKDSILAENEDVHSALNYSRLIIHSFSVIQPTPILSSTEFVDFIRVIDPNLFYRLHIHNHNKSISNDYYDSNDSNDSSKFIRTDSLNSMNSTNSIDSTTLP